MHPKLHDPCCGAAAWVEQEVLLQGSRVQQVRHRRATLPAQQ